MALTALSVKNAKPKGKPYKLADEKGLYLVVTPSAGKLWRFDYRHDEKRKTLAIGKWPEVELATARQRRDNARRRLADGEDPAAADKAEALATENAFESVARNWHAGSKTAWTPRYARLVLGRLEDDIFPHIGKDHIDSIEPPRLLEVIRKVEIRGVIESFFLRTEGAGACQGACSPGTLHRQPVPEVSGWSVGIESGVPRLAGAVQSEFHME